MKTKRATWSCNRITGRSGLCGHPEQEAAGWWVSGLQEKEQLLTGHQTAPSHRHPPFHLTLVVAQVLPR